MPTLVTVSYVLLAALVVASNFVLVPVHTHMLVTTFLIIYIGAHGSLGAGDEAAEAMSSKDAWMFPIMGSAVLFGLYLLFKFFNKDYVNMLLTLYFLLIGLFSIERTIHPAIARFFPKNQRTFSFRFSVPLPFWKPAEPITVAFTTSEIASTLIAVVPMLWYALTKHWTSSNLIGIALSIQGIQGISLGSYRVGAILLSGLFVYDVFWVFGTDVMVTVARSFDVPIKLLFPRALATADTDAQLSMLGLGDIVIPGVFIALLLRFDASEARAVIVEDKPLPSFPKPFFSICVLAYVLGLATTVFVMHAFNAAQPALLYLVPACLLSSSLTAVATRKVRALLAYNEEQEPAAEGSAADGKHKHE